jgi:hypothetical protein
LCLSKQVKLKFYVKRKWQIEEEIPYCFEKENKETEELNKNVKNYFKNTKNYLKIQSKIFKSLEWW